MSKRKEPAGSVVEFDGGDIRRTNRFFISLRSYGQCDEKGKTVLGVGCSAAKLMAEPDKPLALFAMLLDELSPGMRYSSKEAAEQDLKRFQEYVNTLRVD